MQALRSDVGKQKYLVYVFEHVTRMSVREYFKTNSSEGVTYGTMQL